MYQITYMPNKMPEYHCLDSCSRVYWFQPSGGDQCL